MYLTLNSNYLQYDHLLRQRLPDYGARVLFFGGGTAMHGVSKALKHYTHNSVHLLTPFDSGGSSAVLRQAFTMLAVGDVRNRLLALLDETCSDCFALYSLLSYRLPRAAKTSELEQELADLLVGWHGLTQGFPLPLIRELRAKLSIFAAHKPSDFDLRGASIGNLVLTGAYLYYQRDLNLALAWFKSLLPVRGTVKPVVDSVAHLVATLDDGTVVIGQHCFTGKDCPPLCQRIAEVHLSASAALDMPVEVSINAEIGRDIQQAELICYPPGSFYSSLLATLLPQGVGRALAASSAPKVYIPNLAHDPEQYGMSLQDNIDTLLAYLRRDSQGQCAPAQVLNYVLVDKKQSRYNGGLDKAALARLGITVLERDLVSSQSAPYYDPVRLVDTLLELTVLA